MLEQYKTVFCGGEAEIIEKKSRFIATVKPVKSEEEALEFIECMRKKYWNATHNCFAYVIGEHFQVQRCSDDGEPSGTAGKPMLDVLLGEEIHNVAVVVTRYFGGTLLGTGGLVRAYSTAASMALEAGGVSVFERYIEYETTCSYSDYQKIQVILQSADTIIDSTDFGSEIVIKFAVAEDKVEKLKLNITETFAARVNLKEIGERFDTK